MARASAIIAVAAAACLVGLMLVLGAAGPVDLADPPPSVMVAGAIMAAVVPLSVIGVGLGGVVLIRQEEGGRRLALIGVIGNSAVLFLLSATLALTFG